MKRRTYHSKTRADFIRFSEALFQAIPEDLFHDVGKPFEMIITGDVRSAKTLVPLTGIHALSDIHNVEDLLGQKVEGVNITQTSPLAFDQYVPRNGRPTMFSMNGQNVPVSFGHCSRDNGGTDLWMLKLGNEHKHGIHIVTLASIPRKDSRKTNSYPSVPLILDVRRTYQKQPKDHDLIGLEPVLERAVKFERQFLPFQRLSGEWEKVAKVGASSDIGLERSVVLYVNGKNRHGQELLKSEQFLKFWNSTITPDNMIGTVLGRAAKRFSL